MKITKDLLLKKAELRDIPTLSQLGSTTFIETYESLVEDENREMMREYVKQKFCEAVLRADFAGLEQESWIAWLKDQAVGYFKLVQAAPPDFVADSGLLHLERIYVLKAYHGLGLGKCLLHKAESLARRASKGLWLEVWNQNHQALQFYTQQGFQRVGSKKWEFTYQGLHYADTDDVMVKYLVP